MQDESIQEKRKGQKTRRKGKGARGGGGIIRIDRGSATVHTGWKERSVARCMLKHRDSAMKRRGRHNREGTEF